MILTSKIISFHYKNINKRLTVSNDIFSNIRLSYIKRRIIRPCAILWIFDTILAMHGLGPAIQPKKKKKKKSKELSLRSHMRII